MKVLMIVTWYFDRDSKIISTGSFHYEQSISLNKFCDAAILFPIDRSDDKGITKQTESGLLTYRLAQKRTFLPTRFLEMMSDAKKVIEDYQPDIIHAHVAGMAGVVGILLGKRFNIPVVVTEHNPIEMSHYEKMINRMRDRWVYRRSKANICVSNGFYQQMTEVFPDCSFQVIYNGVVAPEKSNSNEKYFVDGAINCSIVGVFANKEQKGYRFLLPAIKSLRDDGLNIMLHICGDGEHMEYYQNMAKELDIESNCIFYGYCNREKVYDIMSQMDFCVSASIFESAGVAVQEAMFFGKPQVITKSGGANSLVTKDTAIVVEKGSIESLKNGIKEMISRLDEFNSELIKKYAYEQFEVDSISKKYMEIYKNSLGKV